MKTIPLVAAIAAALCFAAGASAGPKPGFKQIMTPLGCTASPYQMTLANTTGKTLKKGMRIHFTLKLVSGKLISSSFVLTKDFPAGASFKQFVYVDGRKCSAAVNFNAMYDKNWAPRRRL